MVKIVCRLFGTIRKKHGSDFNMTCTQFKGTGDPVYGTTTWQVTTDADTAFANASSISFTSTGEAQDILAAVDAMILVSL